MALVVCETFASLMGESTRAGVPAYFIRLTGCNLRCRYCDTAYAYEGGHEMTVAALVEMARAQPYRLVLVTGGEPLLQAETPVLLTDLLDAGFTVCLETNGSQPIGAVDARVHRILDVKCPGSGMADHNDWANMDLLTSRDEVKFVVADQLDFTWALEVIKYFRLAERLPVLISPVFGQVSLQEAAAWILATRLPVRLNLQLHKYIWGPEVRGV
ncbi:MAG: radical SAM protein [Deltaproteobacteria bacterium]|nr:radical SAM protein [Deltaproteobacteria bacterium]